MSEKNNSRITVFIQALSFVVALSIFWLILFLGIPDSFSRFFQGYSFGLFLAVLALCYLTLNLPRRYRTLGLLGLTMALVALPLSYKWTSGYSDNGVIAGLLPYKDGKNYFYGASLLLNGLPPVNANQSTERPLFPGFLEFVLFLTGGNLKITLAVLVQLTGIGISLSTRQVYRSFGVLSASIFAALMYFYIQPLIGYAMSETLGFTLGCLGFVMLWLVTANVKWHDLILGLLVLMVAVSARAGAFFIFPMLAIWIGWRFRGEKKFSLDKSLLTMFVVIAAYLLVNSVYPRILDIPPGSSFGNFSYAIYGQVRGGTGWHSAIEELGTRNPSTVYRVAWEYFLEHPISLFIGFAKAYRDFFSLGTGSIFPFGDYSLRNSANVLLWVGAMLLLFLGIHRLLKDVRNNLSSMLIAGFAGVVLSIPFLPPIDGGARFYASTAPFFFVFPALGVGWFSKVVQPAREFDETLKDDLPFSRSVSIAMVLLTLLLPPLIYSLAQKPAQPPPGCPLGQDSFVIEYRPGSYVDLVKTGSRACGLVPEVCQDEFERNNAEKSVDDFYQFLLQSMQRDGSAIRLIPAIDFKDNKFHYFYLAHDKFPEGLPFGVVSGCAVEILTRNQTIYQVESLSPQVDK